MKGMKVPLRGAIALLTLAIAALLCWQCIDIYLTGNAPENLDESGVHIRPVFTAEIVAERLTPVALCALAYVPLLLARALLRAPAERESVPMTAENRLRLMKKRASVLPEAAQREERFRRHVWLATGAVLLLCLGASALFLLDGDNFVSWDLERVMGDMLMHVGPWALLALAAVYAAYVVCDRSRIRECGALRGLSGDTGAPAQAQKSPVNALRIVLYGAAIVFIVLGVMNGGLYDVLVKAINICTECIGLG